MKSYVDWAFDLAPSWLAGPVGELYVKAIGLWHDMWTENAAQAAQAHLMRSNTFMPSTLPLIGRERLIPKFLGELDEDYRARLLDAWIAWDEAATAPGTQDQLTFISLPGTLFNYQGQLGRFPDEPPPVGDVWNWDDDLANWSRYWPEILNHPWESDGLWGDAGNWGDLGTWGSTATVAEVKQVQGIIRRWKPGHVIFQHVLVVLDETGWDLVRPVKLGDRYDIIANRTDTIIYWDGYGRRDPN